MDSARPSGISSTQGEWAEYRGLDEPYSPSAPDLDWGDDAQTARGLADRAGFLRDHLGNLGEDVGETHRQALSASLREAATAKSRKSTGDLLSELSMDRGFAWAAVADLLGISIPALRKWRKDGGVSGPNRARLNQLCAFCDLLAQYAIDDVAAWLDTPILADYYITPRWLYSRYAQAPVALLELASQTRVDPVCWLEELDARVLAAANRRVHELVTEDDGSVAIHQI